MSNAWRIQDPGTLVRVVQGGAAAMVESHFLCQSYSPPERAPEPDHAPLVEQVRQNVRQSPAFSHFLDVRRRLAEIKKELARVEAEQAATEQKRKDAQAALGGEAERMALAGLKEGHPRLQKGITNLLALAQADRDLPILAEKQSQLVEEAAKLSIELPEARDDATAAIDREAASVRAAATPAPPSRQQIEAELARVCGDLMTQLVDAIITKDRGPDPRALQLSARQALLEVE